MTALLAWLDHYFRTWFDDGQWNTLDRFGILFGDVALLLSFAVAIIAWVRREHIRRWFVRNRYPHSVGQQIHFSDWDGMVFTFSRPELPQWLLEKVQPRACVFLASEQSEDKARQLVQQLRSRLPDMQCSIERIQDADDTGEVKRKATEALQWLAKQGARHRVVDVTGGKVPMSIGAFMAAEEAGIPAIYVTSEYDSKLKRIRPNTQRPLLLTSTEREGVH
ncbi:MAG: DUF1887 family protein [Gammaproteobacteria bacterium]|nr:MAG: DUF1887 family protein [Gammaproteobacteria bacterium]